MIIRGIVLSLAVATLAACSSSSSSNNNTSSTAEDSSTSGAVVAAVGGSLGSSSSNGTVSLLGASCPTLLTAQGSGCSAASNIATLTYSDCSFNSSSALWNGYMTVRLFSGSSLTCGTFPNPSADTLERQASTSGGSPGTLTRKSAKGTTVTIDDTLAGVQGNYESDPFNGSGVTGQNIGQINGAYGKKVIFDGGGLRNEVDVVEHISATNSSGTQIMDHTIAGSVNISESGTGAATTWTVDTGAISGGACTAGSGSFMSVYHNLVKMLATTCLQSVTYNTTCCTPVSGTVVTTFNKTTHSTGTIANLMDGKSETLTITGCGTGTYIDYAGKSSSVTLGNCF